MNNTNTGSHLDEIHTRALACIKYYYLFVIHYSLLVITQIRYHLSILRIDMTARDVSDEVILIVHNRKLMGVILVECLYDILHRITKTELCWWVAHQLGDAEMMIKFCTENDMTKFVHVNLAKEITGTVEDRQKTATRLTQRMYQLPKFHVLINAHIIPFDDAVKAHKREYGTVGMVGDKLTLTSQSHTIDAVRLEDKDCEV